MKIRFAIIGLCLVFLGCTQKHKPKNVKVDPASNNVRLMSLDPGHFHAALVHKTMYPNVDSTIHLFAPNGPEVKDFLDKINLYNTREAIPTQWNVQSTIGPDYLGQMLLKKPGNVMVVAGKNSKKIDYVLAAVKAGVNVYADKPLVINELGYDKLVEAFRIAEENNVLIYDIMTERFEVTTVLQKLFSTFPEIFGSLIEGTPKEPAISKESVHHFHKQVSGRVLVRPPWFFDINEEGDGLVDVTTHLVDLIQWEAFPEVVLDTSDIKMLKAKRWATPLTREEFQKVTGSDGFPQFLQKDVRDGVLNVLCNGEMRYTIKGKHAMVSVKWDYEAPKGTGDTHYSIMRGTKSDLIIQQGEEENYRPVLYIAPKTKLEMGPIIQEVMEERVGKLFPGTKALLLKDGRWRIQVPDEFKIGHEAHFSQVTEKYLEYLEKGKLPHWEVPNMIVKYYTTTTAHKLAKNE